MRKLDSKTIVAGQIDPQEIPALAATGVTMIVNNRPDDEEPGQPASAEIEAAAREAGIAYRHVPMGSAGLSQALISDMAEAIEATDGKLLAFCRSGTRSSYLWALAEAQRGRPGEELIEAAAAAGYDLRPIVPHLRQH